LADGEQLNHLFEIYLLIFADLKKHLFNYQFYSTATSVSNYKVLAWTPAPEYFQTHPGDKAELDKFVKLTSTQKEFPQLSVLKRN